MLQIDFLKELKEADLEGSRVVQVLSVLHLPKYEPVQAIPIWGNLQDYIALVGEIRSTRVH